MIVWLEDTNVHSVLAEPALGKGGYHVVRNEARKVLVISPTEFDQLSWSLVGALRGSSFFIPMKLALIKV